MCESSRSHLEKHSAGNKTMFLELNCLHVIAEAFLPQVRSGTHTAVTGWMLQLPIQRSANLSLPPLLSASQVFPSVARL